MQQYHSSKNTTVCASSIQHQQNSQPQYMYCEDNCKLFTHNGTGILLFISTAVTCKRD